MRFLKPGGRFALVTQDTYLEKEWAEKLREVLSGSNTILAIIDLNPCGQLFFHAMNTPAITVVAKEKPASSHKMTIVVVKKPTNFGGLTEAERRDKVLQLTRKTLAGARKSGHSVSEFVEAFQKPQIDFSRTGAGRWNLAPSSSKTQQSHFRWLNLGQLFETRQGVTPGGTGCLDLFLLEKDQVISAGLEQDLVHPVVKGVDIERYRCRKTGQVVLYPYILADKSARAAFDMAPWRAKQRGSIPDGLRSLARCDRFFDCD